MECGKTPQDLSPGTSLVIGRNERLEEMGTKEKNAEMEEVVERNQENVANLIQGIINGKRVE